MQSLQSALHSWTQCHVQHAGQGLNRTCNASGWARLTPTLTADLCKDLCHHAASTPMTGRRRTSHQGFVSICACSASAYSMQCNALNAHIHSSLPPSAKGFRGVNPKPLQRLESGFQHAAYMHRGSAVMIRQTSWLCGLTLQAAGICKRLDSLGLWPLLLTGFKGCPGS